MNIFILSILEIRITGALFKYNCGAPLIDLAPPHFCVCHKSGHEFPWHMSWSFLRSIS